MKINEGVLYYEVAGAGPPVVFIQGAGAIGGAWRPQVDLIGTYEGNWLRIEPHYVNGPAFGGLIGTVGGFELFLRDQLRSQSVLFSDATSVLFYEQQHTLSGHPIPMTLGWQMGSLGHQPYYFKEGGGAGFHCMMRVYRSAGIATIMMANATGLDAGHVLDSVDRLILK
jgi:hypothetical protein